MKKTIGFIDNFIDNFIDEFHSNHYVEMIRKSPRGAEFELTYAWERAPLPGRRDLKQWCADTGMIPAASVEEVVDRCDCIVVLSPNNAELHEELGNLPLRSGKPVYIDKTFAPDRASAVRMMTLAQENHTPLMSTSALRYAPAVRALKEKKPHFVSSIGTGLSLEIYGVHMTEMLVMLLGIGASELMVNASGPTRIVTVRYPDERLGLIQFIPGQNFQVTVQFGEKESIATGPLDTDYFQHFVNAMTEFFYTGVPSIDPRETLEVMSILESAVPAQNTPGKWRKLAP